MLKLQPGWGWRQFSLFFLIPGAVILGACSAVNDNALLTPAPLPAIASTFTPVPFTPLPNFPAGQFGPTSISSELTGGGSARLGPILSKWSVEYKKIGPNVKLNYQITNSGGGRSGFLGTPVATTTALPKPTSPLDFGASDVTFKSQELLDAAGKGEIVHLPVMLGAVAVAYRLDGFKGEFRLSGPTLARIFLGETNNWNDPQILSDNPGVTLPNKPIIVVIRSRTGSGSGTTELFSRYLSEFIDNKKMQKIGVGGQVNWPNFNQKEGNDGTAVANIIAGQDGTIGYVDQEVAEERGLNYASLRNQAGRYIRPTPEALTAAAQGISISDDFRTFIISGQGDTAYPVAGFAWLVVWKDLAKMPSPSLEKAQALANFLWWGFHEGQRRENLPPFFASLPTSLIQKLEGRLVNTGDNRALTYNGKPVLTLPN